MMQYTFGKKEGRPIKREWSIKVAPPFVFWLKKKLPCDAKNCHDDWDSNAENVSCNWSFPAICEEKRTLEG